MKALIIEDEKAAVRNLMALLGEVDPDIEVIDVLDSITVTIDGCGERSDRLFRCHASLEAGGRI